MRYFWRYLISMRVGTQHTRMLLNIGLIIAVVAVWEKRSYAQNMKYNLSDNVKPVHYDVRLTVNIEDDSFNFDGGVDMYIRIKTSTQFISLHSSNLNITKSGTKLHRVKLYPHASCYPYDCEPCDPCIPLWYFYHKNIQILTIKFPREIECGEYVLTFNFANIPSTSMSSLYRVTEGGEVVVIPSKAETEDYIMTVPDKPPSGSPTSGLYRISYQNSKGEEKWLALTNFQPIGARKMFPCFDEPAFKSTFQFFISHPKRYIINAQTESREPDEETDALWTNYSQTEQISTSMLGFIIHDINEFAKIYYILPFFTMIFRGNLKSDMEFAANTAENSYYAMFLTTDLERQAKTTYLYAVPNFPSLCKSHWGVIFCRESALIPDNNFNYATDVAYLIAHSMAHLWFGQLVTPRLWYDLWLTEGLVSFFAIHKILNSSSYNFDTNLIAYKKLHHLLNENDDDMMQCIDCRKTDTPSEIMSFVSNFNDSKAYVMMRMLYHIVPDPMFHNRIIYFLMTNKYLVSGVTSENLWDDIQGSFFNDTEDRPIYKVRDVMERWSTQPGFPIVTVTRDYETWETTISQQCFNLNGIECNIRWWIPVTYTTQTNPDFFNISISSTSLWLEPQQLKNINLRINPNDWIIINLQLLEYYRVNYDHTNWQKIADYLNTNNYTKIHVINRAQIIDDAYFFLSHSYEEIDFVTFLNITNYLSQEVDYVPWYAMFKALEKLSKYFSLPESETLKTHMVNILDKVLDKIGYADFRYTYDSMKLMRLNATNWACILGSSRCREIATNQLEGYLADPETFKFLPRWKKWTFCMGLMEAEMETWSKVLDLYLAENDDTYLEFLTCSENTDIIVGYLIILADYNADLPKQNKRHLRIFNTIIEKYAHKDFVLNYILKNMEILKPRFSSTKTILKSLISNVYSYEGLYNIRNFVNRYHSNDFKERERYDLNVIIALRESEVKLFIDDFVDKFTIHEKKKPYLERMGDPYLYMTSTESSVTMI